MDEEVKKPVVAPETNVEDDSEEIPVATEEAKKAAL